MNGKNADRKPLIFSEIRALKAKGYNQTQIAQEHGVSRQAVSDMWRKYGGEKSVRQIVDESWPWKTTKAHAASAAFQRLRDHGEYMATGGKGMSADKLDRLKKWWTKLRDENFVLEFDPELPPEPGLSPNGGFAYRKRNESDGELLIRVNEFTDLTEAGKGIWRLPTGPTLA